MPLTPGAQRRRRLNSSMTAPPDLAPLPAGRNSAAVAGLASLAIQLQYVSATQIPQTSVSSDDSATPELHPVFVLFPLSRRAVERLLHEIRGLRQLSAGTCEIESLPCHFMGTRLIGRRIGPKHRFRILHR